MATKWRFLNLEMFSRDIVVRIYPLPNRNKFAILTPAMKNLNRASASLSLNSANNDISFLKWIKSEQLSAATVKKSELF